jgi:tRNA threonylcarbamoyladenosine biosynthesis protein TsaE
LVIGLTGDLGSGKTQFVKGLARGLGVTEAVLSPTFALFHQYNSGRCPLYHIDFYRLDTTDQIMAAGLHEYFTPNGITVVEWWDRWQGPPPPRFQGITFETLGETDRRMTYDPPGT